MDISNDHIRRELRASQVEHLSAMAQMRDLVARLFGGDAKEPAGAKAGLVTGGIDRRGFLKVGGLSVASAAVFAACGSDGDGTAAGGDDEDDDDDDTSTESDLTIVRTASSLEFLAVEVYQQAIDSGLVTTPALADAAALFQEQHREHGEMFVGAAKQLGGEPFESANPAVMQTLQPRLGTLADELSVVRLAYDLENIAASTYYSTVGEFEMATLNQSAMAVGGVEARHAAVLASALNEPPVPRAFWMAEGAVEAGTGV